MSKVAIEGNASGTGTLTIAAPNTNSNFTLSLPTNTGTIVTTGTTTGISASAISTGTLAAARLPAGSVLQVVQGTTSIQATNNTNVMADTGLSVSITPTSATSKILVLVAQNGCAKLSGGTESGVTIGLVRNSTMIFDNAAYANFYTGTSLQVTGVINFSYLDSPSTTSAVTYKTQFKNNSNTTGVRVQLDGVGASTITLLEIAA
jgi:hypothetical protein